jgi:hypothetical protein
MYINIKRIGYEYRYDSGFKILIERIGLEQSGHHHHRLIQM